MGFASAAGPKVKQESQPLSAWLRQEAKVLVGVAFATFVGYYVYSRSTENESNSISAAQQRHRVAHSAAALSRRGAHREALSAYTKLLELERARSRASTESINLTKDPGKIDLEQQVLTELGKLHMKLSERQEALQRFKQAASRADQFSQNQAAGTLLDAAAQAAQEEAEIIREQSVRTQQAKSLEEEAENLYIRALAKFISLEEAKDIFETHLAAPGPPDELLEWLDGKILGDNKRRKLSDPESAALASGVLWNLSTLYASMGRLNQAEATLRRCLILVKLADCIDKKKIQTGKKLLNQLHAAS